MLPQDLRVRPVLVTNIVEDPDLRVRISGFGDDDASDVPRSLQSRVPALKTVVVCVTLPIGFNASSYAVIV